MSGCYSCCISTGRGGKRPTLRAALPGCRYPHFTPPRSAPSTSMSCPEVPHLYDEPLTRRAASRRKTMSFLSFIPFFPRFLDTGWPVSALVNKWTISTHTLLTVLWLNDFKKQNEQEPSLPVILRAVKQSVLEPHRPGLEFWLHPSFPVWSQQLLNFSEIHAYPLICTVGI